MITYEDFYNQYVAFTKLFLKKLFESFESGSINELFYSFSFGFGDDISALIAHYACFSPFTVVYLIFDNIQLASCFYFSLKLTTAAFCFCEYLRIVFNKKGFIYSCISTAYALSTFCVAFYYNVIFLDGIYMLPIIMIAIYRLVKNNNWIFLAVSYALTFIFNFYQGYITGFFSFGVFLYLIFYDFFIGNNKYDLKRLLSKCRYFFMAFLTALALSAFILVPAAKYILTNLEPGQNENYLCCSNPLYFYGNLFMGVCQGQEGIFPYIYCGLLPLLSLLIFFKTKNISKKLKCGMLVGLIALILCSFIKPLYAFMHCFNNPDFSRYRFGYLFCFVILTMAASAVSYMEKRYVKILVLFSVLNALIYLADMFFQNKYLDEEYLSLSFIGLIINLLFMLGYCLLIYLNLNKYIGAVFIIELFISGAIIQNNWDYNAFDYNDLNEYIRNEALEATKSIESYDDSFYRIHMTDDSCSNASFLYDNKSLGYYSSYSSQKLINTMEKLGYAVNTKYFWDYGSTKLTQMLFGQKYTINANTFVYNRDDELPYVYENEYTLSLGYAVSDNVKELSLKDLDNPFENQNNLIKAMTGLEEDIYTAFDGNYSVETNNLSVYSTNDEEKIYILQNDKADMEGQLIFNIESNEDIYSYFSQNQSLMLLNTTTVTSDLGDNGSLLIQSLLSEAHILKIKADESGIGILRVKVPANCSYTPYYKNCYFYKENNQAIANAYNVLSKHNLEITDYRDGYIKGKIDLSDIENDNVILFMSLLYDKNWDIYVDGEKVNSYSVLDDTFMALDIQKGIHEIEMFYNNSFLLIALIISITSICFLVILTVFNKVLSTKGVKISE